ncbi:unnamed protein product [marine sediment metagenome]|uniref:Uncharacterized protein n=1 Tax=marine sediment metagenome TaxID=412755 RepID=X1MQ63_9ZZZZ
MGIDNDEGEVKLTKQEKAALRKAEKVAREAKELTTAKRLDLGKATSARHFPPKNNR